MTLQAVVVSFDPNATLTEALWTVLVDNGVQWTNDGWGGLANANTAIYVNPVLSEGDAAKSMAPLIDFGRMLVDTDTPGAKVVVTVFPSYGTFFKGVVATEVAVGIHTVEAPSVTDIISYLRASGTTSQSRLG